MIYDYLRRWWRLDVDRHLGRSSPFLRASFALLAMALLIGGCGGGGDAAEPPPPAGSSRTLPAPQGLLDSTSSGSAPATQTTTPPTSSESDPSVSESDPSADADDGDVAIPATTTLAANGWGPLRVGMSRAEVIAAAGEDANPDAVGGDDPEVCDEFRPKRAPVGLLVMIENGRLSRISLGSGSKVETDRGIGVGDRAAEVRQAYGEEAKSTPHKYVEAPAEYLTVWTVPPPAANARGIVYEVGAEGRISRIHAGVASIQYVEGCL